MITIFFYYKKRSTLKEMVEMKSTIVPRVGDYIYFNNYENADEIKKEYKTLKFKVKNNVFLPQKKDEIISSVLVYLVKA